MEIKEHRQEDITKGIYVLGREHKQKPVDITNRLPELQLVPAWKQTGPKPNDCWGPEGEKLWEKGYFTVNMLDVRPKLKNHWYICLGKRMLGYLILNNDKTYTYSCNSLAACYVEKKGKKEDLLNFCLKLHSEGHEYR